MHAYRRRQFREFGRGSLVHRPHGIFGARMISVGAGSMMLNGLWLAAEQETWGREEAAIEIGDRVSILPNCTISAAAKIVIEDQVTIAGLSSLVDSNHTFGAEGTVLAQELAAEPIHIGYGSWIGQRVTILRGARVGRQCAIGANSVVRGEIPDYSVAVGAPARVVGSTRDPAA